MDRIILLVIALIVAFTLRFLVRRFFARVGAQAVARQPDAIHLQPAPNPAWRNRAAVDEMAGALLAAGFTEAGVFTAPEMPPLILRLFARPDEAACSCIYEHEKVGVWMDLFTRYEDGTGITFTNTRDRGLAQRPGRPIYHFPGMNTADLHRKFVAERPAGAMITITAAQLPRFYEESYAESIAWRKSRGVTAEEVARVAQTRDKS